MKQWIAVTLGLSCGLVQGQKPLMDEVQAMWDGRVAEVALSLKAQVKPVEKRKVLVLSKTSGFYHSSIETAKTSLREMSKVTGAFDVEFNDRPEFYTRENLENFDVILFNNTTYTQDYLNEAQRGAILEFVASGGGFVGIHAAADCGTSAKNEKSKWPEITELIGGAFDGHPWTKDGTYGVKNEDPQHAILDPLSGNDFMIRDELYKSKDYDREKLRVLLSIDMAKSYHKNGRKDHDHALLWVRNYGKGRVFYSTFGHNEVVYTKPEILQIWLNGIQFAAGDWQVDTQRLPQPEHNKNFVAPAAQ